jgi:hypothetical protein
MMQQRLLGSSAVMKTTKLLAPLALVSLLALAACSTGPQVSVMADSSTNFAQYKTFGFVEPLATDKDGYQTIVSTTLKAATTRELAARGITFDPNNPQLLVNFNARLSNKMVATTAPMPVGWGYGYGGGYYGYRRGFYDPWPMYQNQTTVSEYTEGTLNIDVADALRKQLVWEGVVTQAVTQGDYANPTAKIDAAVTAAFAKFPIPVVKN